MKHLENKVAAITGAGSGIGRALALNLAQRGAEVALSDVDEVGLAETVAQAKKLGARVSSRRVDVGDREQVYAWADAVVAEHGRVNLIFNNAGVALASTIEEASYEDFEWIVQINFWGVVYGTKAFLPHLRASGDGHIINTSSVFGFAAVPLNGTYNATKFAVRGFTECLRMELELAGAPVSATSVHPGGIKTNIARRARTNKSLLEVGGGTSEEASLGQMEKLFRTTPAEAARTILAGVEKNAPRVLIGADAYAFDFVTRALPVAYQKIVKAGFSASRRAKR